MLRFHIITRGISTRFNRRVALALGACAIVVANALPASAMPPLEDPGPTLWRLAVTPDARVRDAYLAAGGLADVAATSDLNSLVGATVRRLQYSVRYGVLRAGPPGRSVIPAILDAAIQTGTPSSWLLRTARRESGLNPDAVSSSSSATGLFQFVEDSWLRALHRFGAAHGYSREAAKITVSRGGAVKVDPADRHPILALRFDPRAAALMAAEMAEANRGAMALSLARPVSDAELYVAHFLGVAGAIRLIRAAELTPTASAASILPAAASANPGVFARRGMPLSVEQLLWRLKRG